MVEKSGIGRQAADFTLQDQDENKVSLATYRSQRNVVLIFYPGDNTPGCTKQLCTATNDTERYAEANIVVLGINQGNQASHKAFTEKRKLTMPLLVDENLEVAEKYGAIFRLGPVKIIRRTVVGINTEGTIVYYRRGIPATKDVIDTIRRNA